MSAARLDLRGLEAPEPMVRVLDALDDLADGAVLSILLDREPHPLYRILERHGYRWTAAWREGHCSVDIRRGG